MLTMKEIKEYSEAKDFTKDELFAYANIDKYYSNEDKNIDMKL